MDPPSPLLQLPRSRRAGFIATVLAHAAIVAGWQQARRISLPEQVEPGFVQWVRVPEVLAGPAAPPVAPAPPRTRQPAPSTLPPPQAIADAGPSTPAPVPTVPGVEAEPVSVMPDADPAGAATRQMIELAKRDAGAADRSLREEGKPLILAPRDSPQIRMAKKLREAAALAPNRWYEAPKIVELVNDGGDGARRFRVLTPLGIYCITERSPATSIDMIEKHGKQRITNCGHEHEQPANPQEWRTTRDYG